MKIEDYFKQEKGITVDNAFVSGAKYTAIDICKFAKNYHEHKVKNLSLGNVSKQRELLIATLIETIDDLLPSNNMVKLSNSYKKLKAIYGC